MLGSVLGEQHWRSSQFRHFPDEPFCHGDIRAEHIEPQVWQEIERVLSDPALITAELERREHEEAATTEDITKEFRALQKALDTLAREAQRWDEAYAHDVINLAELKAMKLDIAERKQRLLAQQEAAQATLHVTQQHHAKMQEILTYFQHIQSRLTALDIPNKRLILEALDITVTWTPGEPLVIDGCIPITIASTTS